mmetsp:Transcript_12229/g.34984  ORF Transcript_12229/g.34984 Transcript_12229/m.34984 type:complete len:110 (-) Transcript_12229:39-368(-)
MSSDAVPSVVVALKDKATEEMIRFRVKPTMKMGKVLGKYEKHKGVGPGTFRYLIDGDRLPSSEVNEKLVQKYLDEYGDDDDDEGYDILIECYLEVEGGAIESYVASKLL